MDWEEVYTIVKGLAPQVSGFIIRKSFNIISKIQAAKDGIIYHVIDLEYKNFDYVRYVEGFLIGYILRHGRVDNDVFFYFILDIFMSGLTAFLALHMNLNTGGGMSNETLSEGCVKWGKSQNVDEETSTLDLISVNF